MEGPVFSFIYLFSAVLGLDCCAQAFSSGSEEGFSLAEICRLLTAVVSLETTQAQSQELELQELWLTGLVAPTACGTFPDQGSNLCLLHWQANS